MFNFVWTGDGKQTHSLNPDEVRRRLKTWMLDQNLETIAKYDTKQLLRLWVTGSEQNAMDSVWDEKQKFDLYKACRKMIVDVEVVSNELAILLRRHYEGRLKKQMIWMFERKLQETLADNPLRAVRDLYAMFGKDSKLVTDTFGKDIALQLVLLYNF